jgi:hypothetical protein
MAGTALSKRVRRAERLTATLPPRRRDDVGDAVRRLLDGVDGVTCRLPALALQTAGRMDADAVLLRLMARLVLET